MKKTLAEIIASMNYTEVENGIYRFADQSDLMGSDPRLFTNKYRYKVNEEMEESGYVPASIWELLDFIQRNPSKIKGKLIVAPGSFWIHEVWKCRAGFWQGAGMGSVYMSSRYEVTHSSWRDKKLSVTNVKHLPDDAMILGVKRDVDTSLCIKTDGDWGRFGK